MRPGFPAGVAALAVAFAWADEPAVTIYNQKFGVVRERIRLELKGGPNRVSYSEVTAHIEPDSVILRDPSGRRKLQILEQNYRNDPLSQALLLSLFEGQEIQFLGDPAKPPVKGKIIRSGYVPHLPAWNEYGQGYAAAQSAYVGGGSGDPIIEVDGVIRFGLPGAPLFPSLSTDAILKPTLHWIIATDIDGPLDAELSYVTGGMSWQADYNIVSPEAGDELELIGWVTIDNQSGRHFPDAHVKLMAGDVRKEQPPAFSAGASRRFRSESLYLGAPVTERTFDEYHLYTLERPTTIRDRESKQVEFIRASGIASRRVYVYEGALIDENVYAGWSDENRRDQPDYGTRCNKKVWVMREFENTAANGLGMPLPAGRLRFYRQDADQRLEFIGENEIDHTPRNEQVRVYTGNAFDIVGERRRTNYNVDHSRRWMSESFEIELRNRKAEPVEVRVVERLYRWFTWKISEKSREFEKTEAQRIEFRVPLEADGKQIIQYTVEYTW